MHPLPLQGRQGIQEIRYIETYFQLTALVLNLYFIFCFFLFRVMSQYFQAVSSQLQTYPPVFFIGKDGSTT